MIRCNLADQTANSTRQEVFLQGYRGAICVHQGGDFRFVQGLDSEQVNLAATVTHGLKLVDDVRRTMTHYASRDKKDI